MKYVVRLFTYLIIFGFSFSLFSVLALSIVPVTVTPLKIIRLIQNLPDEGFTVKSRWTTLDNINPVMVRAVIATEDNNFLTHYGFDLDAIKDAIQDNKRRKRVRGASTISQQTAKNVFCLPDRTWVRKGIETYFTAMIETFWTKRRIMEVYLNIIETHANIYGVGATSRIFYDKPAEKLNTHEASMIATVLPNPLRMNLGAPSNYMVRRSTNVRRLMRQLPEINFDHPVEIKAASRKRRK